MAQNKPQRVSIVTLGCEKKTVDSEVLMGGLKHQGVQLVNDPSLSDIIILNTCGFIDLAKQESIDTIVQYANIKQAGGIDKLYVTGCLSQRYNIFQ